MTDPDVPKSKPKPGTRPGRRRSRGTVRWWGVALAVAIGLIVANAVAAVIGPDLPRLAGTDEETIVKEGDIQAQSAQQTDVVALGASETAAGIDPKALDEATTSFTGAYNAAMRGASPSTNEAWAERVVVPTLDPKVAVVGVLPWSLAVLDGDGADFQARSDDAYAAAIDEVDPDRLGQVEQSLEDRLPLFRYRNELRSPTNVLNGIRTWATGEPADVAPSLDPATIRANIDPAGQSREYLARPEGQGPDPKLAGELSRVSTGDFDLADLEALLRSLQAQGVAPVLAIAPVDRATLEASGFDFEAIDEVTADIVALAERLDVPVSDQFRGDFGTDLFHDKEHLNAQGSQRWSREIGQWLDELCTTGDLGDACPPPN